MRYIETLREGETIREVYLCKQAQVLKSKVGKNYMSLTLQDKTGRVDGKIWDLGPGVGHFEPLDYVKVDAQVTVFNSANQLNIRSIRRAEPGEYDVADYMPCTNKDISEMYAELLKFIESVKEPHLKQLLLSFFGQEAFAKQFRTHSAARTVHHGFVGGLLEHTLGVTRICNYLARNYPVLNRDLLLTAAMFHDVGKLREISDFPENDYTDDGNLLGHIFLGAEMVGAHIREIPGFPQKLASELRHCILAHHRKPEFGSPKVPALAEAMALAMADDLDAKMEQFTELFRTPEYDGGWLGFQRTLESNVRQSTRPEK
ncbi:MAG: HD domain-containing protein [Lachnospiraceae bacterium]|nr:HD domain-containing protein [Lachnospiraceae bacterium]